MTQTRSTYDLVVAGGGIFGLSIAYEAVFKGLAVAVVEREKIGAGASGGLLGALMPHMPARWNPKKAFQFAALTSLEPHIRALEERTGLSTGYGRCGRLLPIASQDRLDHHHDRAAESVDRWQTATTGFSYDVLPAGAEDDWLAPASAPFGLVRETLAARVAPRRYLAALRQAVAGRGTVIEGEEVIAFDEATSEVQLSGATGCLSAKACVFATGHSAYPMIERDTGQTIGRGEKGQAILLEGKGLEDRPAIYCDGLYVVPHDDGTVAVGSTSDRNFEDAAVDPARSRDLSERATRFCPALEGRKMLAEWAGIRPRCNTREPVVGRLPTRNATYLATGGFKISFGIAHLVARGLVAEICDETPEVALPDGFRAEAHFRP